MQQKNIARGNEKSGAESSMTILICGILGKMGRTLADILLDEGTTVVGVDKNASVDLTGAGGKKIKVHESFSTVCEKVDATIDFSSPSVLEDELEWAKKNCVPLVLATTGYTAKQLEDIKACSGKLPVFKTANFSLGVNLLQKLVREAAEILGEKFDIEIIERHHNKKADAPSGTALMLAETANSAFDGKKEVITSRSGNVGKRGNEIGIHAVRGGTIVGEHEVVFAGEDEIITLSHSASSKRVFALGAIAAAKWIVGKSAGLYSMSDML